MHWKLTRKCNCWPCVCDSAEFRVSDRDHKTRTLLLWVSQDSTPYTEMKCFQHICSLSVIFHSFRHFKFLHWSVLLLLFFLLPVSVGQYLWGSSWVCIKSQKTNIIDYQLNSYSQGEIKEHQPKILKKMWFISVSFFYHSLSWNFL